MTLQVITYSSKGIVWRDYPINGFRWLFSHRFGSQDHASGRRIAWNCEIRVIE